jgi:hypothetical protein
MSRAMMARKAEPESAPRARAAAGRLKISQPGDAFEREADRVADAVTSGGGIPSWSLSSIAVSEVQRQGTPDAAQPASTSAPQPNNYKEAAQKAGAAFLQTDVGKKLKDAAAQDPLAKGAQDFLSTLPGKIIAGTTAAAAVAAMAATHTPLPAQLPEIPLDQIRPGLKVKITWEGPVDHPTKAMIAFSYSPGETAKKKKGGATESERYRAETARMAADMDKFRAGMTYAPGSPQDLQQKGAEQAIQSWMAKRLGALPGTPGGAPLVPGAAAGSKQPAGTELKLPSYQSPLAPRTPHLLDQQLQLKPMSEAPASEDTKREEQPVQRKAVSDAEASVPSWVVDEFLRSSSGRPIDHDTRGSMESRFGVDFSQVRVHTDAGAAASARSVSASAYTVGNDVVFASGHYAPHTDQRQHLLAHELAHVVQQGGTGDATSGHESMKHSSRSAGQPTAGAARLQCRTATGGTRHVASGLRISSPGDTLEREADRIAEALVSDGAQSGVLPVPTRSGALIQRCACGDKPKSDGEEECESCKAERRIQRKATDLASEGEAPSLVNEVLSTPGRPLDQQARSFYEPRFGCDFSSIRIHTDESASESARSVNALAYTVGNHVVFASGRYAPESGEGRRLLAHELVHTVQQEPRSRTGVLQRQTEESTGPTGFLGKAKYLFKDFTNVARPSRWKNAKSCLTSLFPSMKELTFERWIPIACARSASKNLYSREWDAFGHCWIACEGTRQCGGPQTFTLGLGREVSREWESRTGGEPHDSLTQDISNQVIGRASSLGQGTCFSICDDLHKAGHLNLTAPKRTCIDCNNQAAGEKPCADADPAPGGAS